MASWINKNSIRKIDLGERGQKISGGQILRLAFARTFFHRKDLIIIDEGTSALDGIQEDEIKKILYKLRKNSIIIMVAHKISTVQNCDEIFVIDNGRVIERCK